MQVYNYYCSRMLDWVAKCKGKNTDTENNDIVNAHIIKRERKREKEYQRTTEKITRQKQEFTKRIPRDYQDITKTLPRDYQDYQDKLSR